MDCRPAGAAAEQAGGDKADFAPSIAARRRLFLRRPFISRIAAGSKIADHSGPPAGSIWRPSRRELHYTLAPPIPPMRL